MQRSDPWGQHILIAVLRISWKKGNVEVVFAEAVLGLLLPVLRFYDRFHFCVSTALCRGTAEHIPPLQWDLVHFIQLPAVSPMLSQPTTVPPAFPPWLCRTGKFYVLMKINSYLKMCIGTCVCILPCVLQLRPRRNHREALNALHCCFSALESVANRLPLHLLLSILAPNKGSIYIGKPGTSGQSVTKCSLPSDRKCDLC